MDLAKIVTNLFLILFFNVHSFAGTTRSPNEWTAYCKDYKNLSNEEKKECRNLFNPLLFQQFSLDQITSVLEIIPQISVEDFSTKKIFEFVHEVVKIIKGKISFKGNKENQENNLRVFKSIYSYSIDPELSEMFYRTILILKKFRKLTYEEEMELTTSNYFSKNWKTLLKILKENKLFSSSNLLFTFTKKMGGLRKNNLANMIMVNDKLQPSYIKYNLEKKKIVIITSLTCGFSLNLLREIESNASMRTFLKKNGIIVFPHFEFDNFSLLKDWMKKLPEQNFAYIDNYQRWPKEIDWFSTPNTLIVGNNRLIDQHITNSISQVLDLFNLPAKGNTRPK